MILLVVLLGLFIGSEKAIANWQQHDDHQQSEAAAWSNEKMIIQQVKAILQMFSSWRLYVRPSGWRQNFRYSNFVFCKQNYAQASSNSATTH